MKRKSSKLALLALLPVLIFFGCNKDIPVDPNAPPIDNTYIVALDLSKDNSIQSDISIKDKITSFIASHGISADKVVFVYDAALIGFAAKLNQKQIDALKFDKALRYIEKDKIWALDFLFEMNTRPGGGRNSTPLVETLPWGIETVGGPGTPRTGVKVWIIDSGIDLDHDDLNVEPAYPAGLSKTFVTSGQDASTPDDMNGHGSHVSGTIGAIDNEIGVIGVAPGVRLVAVKVFNQYGAGLTSSILAGINYVAITADSGDVANMSLGYNGVATTVDEAVYNCSVYRGKSIYFSLAAGNGGADASNFTPGRIGRFYNSTLTDNIVSVSAFDNTYTKTSWSNYGYPVEWSAPGVNIYSTYKNNGYAILSGTSMAAPHVAGIMAIVGAPSNIVINTSVGNRGYIYGDADAYIDPIASH